MTLSLVYQMKRKRLVSLMLLILGLMVVALVMVPRWQPAGPVFAERVGGGVALVLVEPGEVYRVSWRRADGFWEETEPFTGRVTATMGGDRLVVFHGLSYTTYSAGDKGGAPVNERWDRFTPSWPVHAAAAAPQEGPTIGSRVPEVQAWAFGTLDGRTIVSACLKKGLWHQGPELKRSGEVGELTATAGELVVWLWWRENGRVVGAPMADPGRIAADPEDPGAAASPPRLAWGEPRDFDVPADGRFVAGTSEKGPCLFAVSRLRKKQPLVTEVVPDGGRREVSVRQDPPLTAGIDSVSVADGNPPAIAAVSGLNASLAFLDKDKSFEDLPHTLFRFRPGALPWFMAMMFASLSIVGIGVSLLFERRRVSAEAMAEQARMLSNVAPLLLRLFAASVDTGPFLWGFAWLAVEAGVGPTVAWIGAISLCCAYHAAAEATWGQTLGKKLAGIAVRRTDGSAAGKGRIFVRNIVRGIELMFPIVPAIVMISTKRSQRLGDLVAGTMVTRLENEPQPEREEA